GSDHAVGLAACCGEDPLGLSLRLLLDPLGALVRGRDGGGHLLLDVREALLRCAGGLGGLLPLLPELLLGLRELLTRSFEATREVVELLVALVESEAAEPDLLLGARDPVLGRLLRIALDPVGKLDSRPDELERFEPRRTVVRREARGACIQPVGVWRQT